MAKIQVGPIQVHRGVANASGAVPLKPGSTEILVADDEDQDLTMIRLYDAAVSGDPEGEFPLSKRRLRLDPQEPEIDLEAGTWLGPLICWIGSHSRSKNNKPRPSRRRLFATELRKKGSKLDLVIRGKPYGALMEDLISNLGRESAGTDRPAELTGALLEPEKAPKKGGLSIEGLSATSKPGELVIGFRSPVVKKKAIAVFLTNAHDVLDRGASAQFGPPALLDLGGLGIRSLEFWKSRKEFLILAGGSGQSGDFALYRWPGGAKSRPKLVREIDFKKLIDEKGVAPEGMFIAEQTDTVYFVWDEGKRKDAKSSPSFRSVGVSGL